MDEPESMVLEESDYEKLSETQDYLAAKLLTIFMEYPIVFIGYSLNDPDIQSILKSIARCLGPNNISLLRNRFMFVTRGEDQISTHSIAYSDIGEISMTKIETNDFGAVYEAIGQSKCSFSSSKSSPFDPFRFSLRNLDVLSAPLRLQPRWGSGPGWCKILAFCSVESAKKRLLYSDHVSNDVQCIAGLPWFQVLTIANSFLTMWGGTPWLTSLANPWSLKLSVRASPSSRRCASSPLVKSSKSRVAKAMMLKRCACFSDLFWVWIIRSDLCPLHHLNF